MTSGSVSRIALTFEVGGDPEISARMLDGLRETGTVATLFLDGAWADRNRDLVRQMAADGHELGNHAYTHRDFTGLSDDAMRDELRRTDALARELTGRRAFPWFRPPYAALDDRVRRVVTSEGYRVIQRNAVDGGHWPGETTVEAIVQRTLAQAAAGAVIAYHLNFPKTLDALPQIIHWLREGGYSPVRLSDLKANLADVSEQLGRHPDFASLTIDPGFLEVAQRGARVWSMNLLEYGARPFGQQPEREPVTVAQWNGSRAVLVTGEPATDGGQPARDTDAYVLVLAGEVELRIYNGDTLTARAVARPGDMVLWPVGHTLRWVQRGDGQRWIALVLTGGA